MRGGKKISPRRERHEDGRPSPGSLIERDWELLRRTETDESHIDISNINSEYISSYVEQMTQDVMESIEEDDVRPLSSLTKDGGRNTRREHDEQILKKSTKSPPLSAPHHGISARELERSFAEQNVAFGRKKERFHVERHVADVEQLFEGTHSVDTLSQKLDSKRQMRQDKEIQSIMASLNELCEDVETTKSSLDVRREPQTVTKGENIHSQLAAIDSLLESVESNAAVQETSSYVVGRDHGTAPESGLRGSHDDVSKRSETSSKEGLDDSFVDLLHGIETLERKLDGEKRSGSDTMSIINRSGIAKGRGTPGFSNKGGRTPLRRYDQVLHAQRRHSPLYPNPEMMPRHAKHKQIPFYGNSSRATETALLFFQSRARESEKRLEKSMLEAERARHTIHKSGQTVARLERHMKQIIPLLVDLIGRKHASQLNKDGSSKDVHEIKEAMLDTMEMIVLNYEDDEELTLGRRIDGDLAHVQAGEMPNIASYVENKLEDVASSLREAELILSSTDALVLETSEDMKDDSPGNEDVSSGQQRNTSPSLSRSKEVDSLQTSVDAHVEVESTSSKATTDVMTSSTASKMMFTTSDDKQNPQEKEAISQSARSEPQTGNGPVGVNEDDSNDLADEFKEDRAVEEVESGAQDETASMTTQEKIVYVIERIVHSASGDRITRDAVELLCSRYFDVIDIDRRPLAAYTDAMTTHCMDKGGTISRDRLVTLLYNVLITTPSYLLRLACTFDVSVPSALVSGSEFEDRIAKYDAVLDKFVPSFVSGVAEGDQENRITISNLSKFIQWRNASIEPPSARAPLHSASTTNALTTSWCSQYGCPLGAEGVDVSHFARSVRLDFCNFAGAYGRLANAYGVEIPSESLNVIRHRDLCCRLASELADSRGFVHEEALWTLANVYETSCKEGDQFRAPGLVARLSSIANVDDHSDAYGVLDVARRLELFFWNDPGAVSDVLGALLEKRMEEEDT